MTRTIDSKELKTDSKMILLSPVQEKVNLINWGEVQLPKKFMVLEVLENINSYSTPYTNVLLAEEVKNTKGESIIKTYSKALPHGVKFTEVVGREKLSFNRLVKTNIKNNVGLFLTNKAPGYNGSDPEFFVENDKGEIIPAFKFLPDKKNGLPTEELNGGQNLRVYWDGFQAEFETNGSTGCLERHLDSVAGGLRTLLKKAKEYDKTARISGKTLVQIREEMLSQTDPQYSQFGCMPSLNAYGLKGSLEDSTKVTYRSCGGHMHFGIGRKFDDKLVGIVKMLDKIVGVCSVSLFEGIDSPIRRQYYGLAGEYRTPAHGMEYRVLSNALFFHPAISNLMFDLARKVMQFYLCGHGDLWRATEEETVETIMNCDVKKARQIMRRNKAIIIGILDFAYQGRSTWKEMKPSEAGYNALYRGMLNVCEEATNVEYNWVINGQITSDIRNGYWTTMCRGTNKQWNTAFKAIAEGKKI